MAKSTELPIYIETYKLLVHIMKITANYPRTYRHILAKDICNNAQSLVNFIFKANCSRDKLPHLEQVKENADMLKFQLRLSKDLNLISVGQFAVAVEHLDNVGKQLSGWIKYSKKSDLIV